MSTDRTDGSVVTQCDGCSVKILSSWNCATENGLEKTLMVQKDSGEDIDPTNLMSTDTCIFLTRKGKEADEIIEGGCSITLRTSGNAIITNISVLSEARLVEVHGPCEEYLKTVRGEFLLEVEDTTVYCADIKLDPPYNYLLLKFNGLSRENDLWLYGILVQWKPSSHGLNSLQPNGSQYSPFNLEAVDRRLTELGHDMTGNAQHYKKILELCSLSSKDSRGNIQAARPSITSLMASMFTGSHAQPMQQKESAMNQTSHYELLLDQKLKQLEQNILVQIDKRIEKMEQRQHAFITATFEKMMKQFHLSKDQPFNMD